MVMTTTRGKNGLQNLSVNEFVESIISHFGHNILLKEEHISRTDKLKKYRQYHDGREVKDELANMLGKFVTKYNTNDYVRKVDFYASKQEGLSNYIELTFNTPFGSKEWLKHMKIRVSDHPKMNDRKVDEYIYLEGKSVEDIEKELDKIVNKRIRRLEREFDIPMAQNESLRRNNNMKLRINENKYNLDWKEVGTETIYIGDERYRLPIYEKRLYNKIVIQVVPEEEKGELIWTVYYTPEIGKVGFKYVESGFFYSEEAMDYVDNEFIGKSDIFNINEKLTIKESNNNEFNSMKVKNSCIKMCKIYKSVLEELT